MYSWNIYYEEKKWRKLYAIIKQELTRFDDKTKKLSKKDNKDGQIK